MAKKTGQESNTIEVFDDHNVSDFNYPIYEQNEPKDMYISGAMKILFVVFGIVGMIYSILSHGYFQAIIWLIAIVFMMDMMNSFDKLKKFIQESRKPRGGYESVE
jgi:hypothetical protein